MKKTINPRLLGLLLLIVIAAGTGIIYQMTAGKKEPIRLTGYLGGEKIGFIEDEEVQEILRHQYGIEIDYSKAGSLDMVILDQEGMDYLFPSSQTALEYYRELKGEPAKSEIILNTPIVLYTHKIVSDVLEEQGIVSEEDGVMYLDMAEMARIITEERSWKEIGLPELYGNVSIDTTDPAKSNSGNMFAGLLANTLNGGVTVDEEALPRIFPQLQEVFDKLGYMETSSSDLFSQFLKMGVGAKPIIAGYESQLLEFAVEQPDDFAKIKDDIVMLYPSPTVWSTHIYIALTENGEMAVDGQLGMYALLENAWPAVEPCTVPVAAAQAEPARTAAPRPGRRQARAGQARPAAHPAVHRRSAGQTGHHGQRRRRSPLVSVLSRILHRR